MAPSVQQVAQIFEDPEPPESRKRYSRVASVGEVLRGRRKENSPSKISAPVQSKRPSPSPLGERHINSPPQPVKIPLKQDDARLSLHKRTGSSASLKDLVMGRQRNSHEDAFMENRIDDKMKQKKSSTNLTGFLKKRSKKDLRDDLRNQENVSPTKPKTVSPTPLWQQFATQPLVDAHGTTHLPQSRARTVEEEIALYTPKEDIQSPSKANTQNGGLESPVRCSMDYKPPQRPYLEHRSSRSSIFKEDIDNECPVELDRPKSRDRPAARVEPPHVEDARVMQEVKPSTAVADVKVKRSSRVLDVISTLNFKTRTQITTPAETESPMSPSELIAAFEKVLDARNIPLNMRDTMRNLKPELKLALMRGDRSTSSSSAGSTTTSTTETRNSARSPNKREADGSANQDEEVREGKRSRSRSRTRSRILTLSKRECPSPTKTEKVEPSIRSRSRSRPKSADLTMSRPSSSRGAPSTTTLASQAAPESATTPGDFIHYLKEIQKPALVEVGKIHKLRILLRNESVTWTDFFVRKGGMDELVQLFYRINKVEWREEHEDNLLHETLLCLKALCTTDLALQRFEQIEQEFFPTLLAMLFDPERKGPSEFNTRAVIVSLLFAHLSAVLSTDENKLEARAKTVLSFLKDPGPGDDKQLPEFVTQMHVPRPYRVWCKEVVNVTKEVFWIFLHHMNEIPVLEHLDNQSYSKEHFPPPRPPHPAAPYTGGVEWEATQYLATHLDLLNGIIASIRDQNERNSLREDLRQSGWEKIMGGSLRTCKEKFYGGVHDGLKVWVSAAKADGWFVDDVRTGPPREQSSPRKSPVKKTEQEAPKLSFDVGGGSLPKVNDDWL